MNDEKNTTAGSPKKPDVDTGTPPKTETQSTAKQVTSSKTFDLPDIGWGIHAGETRDLPEDEDSCAEILSKPYVTLIK